jgi:hypothetical protein
MAITDDLQAITQRAGRELDAAHDFFEHSKAEIKATRDILEHNAGVVNETYRRKAGKIARYEVGERVGLEDAYHLESWGLMKKVERDLTESALSRLSS